MKGLLELPMKICLADYKEGIPVEVQEQYDPKALDLEFVDLHYLAPLYMEGVVEKGPDTLMFRGHLTSEVENICGRCLKHVTARVDRSFDLFYEIKDKEFVETLDDLRETMLLDHQIAFACTDSCRGLCPHCGINRNESNCNCESKMRSDAFSGLKQIWEKKHKK